MRKILISFMFILAGFTGIVYCGNISKIELIDGSLIQGEVVSLSNGTYTIKTASLGEVKIEASKVRNIGVSYGSVALLDTKGLTGPAIQSDDVIKSQVSRIQDTMASNPAIMQKVVKLASDQQFQELLKDPDIVNAAKSGDVKSLMNNQKLLGVINNPKFQEIKNEVEQKN